MTLTQLLAACYEDLGYDPAPSAAVVSRLTRYVNEGYRHILSMSEFSPLRSNTLAFTSVPNQKAYGFPQALQTIDSLTNTTQGIRLRLMTLDQMRTIDPQEVSSGTPTNYVPLGYGPVKREPASTGIWAVSSNPTDTTQVAKVWAVSASAGVSPTIANTVTLNGLTRVPFLPGYSDLVAIQVFELSAVPVGTVTLYDAAVAGNVLAEIPTGQLTSVYQQIRLWPTPAAADAYAVDGDVNLNDLSAPYDIPLIPSDFQLVLADYARMREYEYRDDTRFSMAQGRYQQKLTQMRNRIMDPPDYRPRVGRIPDRGSNLGSYFPPGRW